LLCAFSKPWIYNVQMFEQHNMVRVTVWIFMAIKNIQLKVCTLHQIFSLIHNSTYYSDCKKYRVLYCFCNLWLGRLLLILLKVSLLITVKVHTCCNTCWFHYKDRGISRKMRCHFIGGCIYILSLQEHNFVIITTQHTVYILTAGKFLHTSISRGFNWQ
jgi:hypothetical protein